MNGRIKELYKSALKYAADDGEEVMVEKFAELIIKECIKVCDGNHEYKNHTDTFFGKGIAEGIQICKIQIADRFGVDAISKPEPPAGRVFKEWIIPK